MGFAWRYASQVWQVSHWLGDGLVILAMIIWGLLTGAFITRLIRFPHGVLAEVRHPVLSSFVSCFRQRRCWWRWFCSVVSPTGGVPVQFWCRGSVGLCRLANCGIMARITLKKLPPGLYPQQFITAYQLACGALGYTDAGLVFLGAGVFSLAKPGTGDLAASAPVRENYPRHCGHHSAFSSLLRWWPVVPG